MLSGQQDNNAAHAPPDTLIPPRNRYEDGVLDTHSASNRQVARELLGIARMRSRRSIVDVRQKTLGAGDHASSSTNINTYSRDDSFMTLDNMELSMTGDVMTNYGSTIDVNDDETTPLNGHDKNSTPKQHKSWETLLHQTTAVLVICLLNMMIAIPFGASYFPVGWKAAGSDNIGEDDTDGISGTFPLEGKQALGIRMFLFATFMGQLAFTFASNFTNPVGLQMVENVPFLHALCFTVIERQGYGEEALSTVFFMFGLSSVLVGITFYLLGKWNLGRIVYFFPNHVLVGCIGGIGVFIVITSIEVTTDVTFTWDQEGLTNVAQHWNLLLVVLTFEVTLRLLCYITQDAQGRPKYPYLSPVYYCAITPIFYLGLHLCGMSLEEATEQGFFFPATEGGGDSSSLWDMFQIVNVTTISWKALWDSIGTMIALVAFSLIHVPINIPAFAISTDVETDMNVELMAHGYANIFSGVFGGLQNYITYSNSVLYAKSGGNGKVSSLAIVFLTIVLFVIGPEIASYLPRCMAGTLLLHIGIDLVLEGVYDSYGNYDYIEYAGIWVIAIVMTIWGMTSALIAGVIAALSTYAVQSINYQNPIRQILSASTLRSSDWNRCATARDILDSDDTGRSRILIFQLQGHIFFGNIAQLTDTIKDRLKEKDQNNKPIVVIIDFTLVVGMDSSAAHAVAKLKKVMHRMFEVEVSIFVTGSGRGGFPCEYALSQALCQEAVNQQDEPTMPEVNGDTATNDDSNSKRMERGSISVSPGSASVRASLLLAKRQQQRPTEDQVCESLDEALRFAEDILIARENPSLANICDSSGSSSRSVLIDVADMANDMTLDEEQYHAKKHLKELFASSSYLEDEDDETLHTYVEIVLSLMERKEYSAGDILWHQGDAGDSAQLLVFGQLRSIIDDTGASELVQWGNLVGELGLVQGMKRLTTLKCESSKAIVYILQEEQWLQLRENHAEIATLVDAIALRYLAHRVQHVSNRYFHTTLPV